MQRAGLLLLGLAAPLMVCAAAAPANTVTPAAAAASAASAAGLAASAAGTAASAATAALAAAKSAAAAAQAAASAASAAQAAAGGPESWVALWLIGLFVVLAIVLALWALASAHRSPMGVRSHWGGFGGEAVGFSMSPPLAALAVAAALLVSALLLMSQLLGPAKDGGAGTKPAAPASAAKG